MTNLIDENDLLVFDPASASIIFTVGDGILTKSKKVVSSLTQALILFSDKVVNQEISFIRFQNHRMVFIHERDLYGVKLVPKDQLTKNFVPSIKIILNIYNQLKKLDKTIQDQSEEVLKNTYNLFKNPEQNLYIFQESIEGYLCLLTVMAGLNYDLFINLDSIKKNFIILKENSSITIDQPDIKGILCFGVNANKLKTTTDQHAIIQFDLIESIFGKIFTNINTLYELVSHIIGKESSSFIIAQIINREQSINEVALSLVKLPDTAMAVDIAIEAIANFSKEQRLAKPLYRIIIKRLKDLEGKIDIDLSTRPNAEKIIQEVKEPPKQESKPPFLETVKVSDRRTEATPPLEATSSLNSSVINSLTNEFTSKLEDLAKKEATEPKINQNITLDIRKDDSEQKVINKDLSELKQDKNHIFMENFKIYFDFTPFRLGLKPENIFYRPSIQVIRLSNEKTQFIVRLEPERNAWFLDILNNLKSKTAIDFNGENGVFEISTVNENIADVFRTSIWASIIELTYSIQKGEIELPEILNIENKSNLCLILDLPPERKKQLPSQIEEIIEEDKIMKGSGVEDIVKSIDNSFVALSGSLKTKRGVGFVLRKNSKELPLILEFILTLSEITGIGWSRW